MNRVYGLIVGVVAVVLLFIVIFFVWLRDDPVGETVEVTRGDLEVTIETIGRVEARDQSVLTAAFSTRVETVAVAPGDQVDEGDVLVKLDKAPAESAVADARAQLVQAESNLAMIESQSGGEQAPLPQRIEAQQRVQEAEDTLAQAKEMVAESLVVAPSEGTIIDVPVQEGRPAGEGDDLVLMAGLDRFTLNVDIDEVDLPLVEPGAEARIILEAYPDREILSTIHSVSHQAESVGGTTVFPATIRFEAQEDLLILPGMNAEVEIRTDVREDVLLIPESALQTVGRRTYVDVVTNGDTERREIRTGARSGGMVEVADGLQEGDEVVLP